MNVLQAGMWLRPTYLIKWAVVLAWLACIISMKQLQYRISSQTHLQLKSCQISVSLTIHFSCPIVSEFSTEYSVQNSKHYYRTLCKTTTIPCAKLTKNIGQPKPTITYVQTRIRKIWFLDVFPRDVLQTTTIRAQRYSDTRFISIHQRSRLFSCFHQYSHLKRSIRVWVI